MRNNSKNQCNSLFLNHRLVGSHNIFQAAPPCIVALDYADSESMFQFLDQVSPATIPWVKIGLQMFCNYGPSLVEKVGARGYNIFLDLKLPDISGDELYAKLKEDHPDLPIVIITGYPDSEILSKILSSGPVTVIKKPIEFDQLNRTVKILGHKGAEGSN